MDYGVKIMINEKLEKAINEQINKEIYSSYLYLSMASYLADLGLMGFSNWMRIQVQEENAHAMGLYDYLIERGGSVELEAIAKPQTTWENILHVFEATLEHEQFVTKSLNELADVADEVKDRASLSFLDWYLKEQVEEENNVGGVLAKLELIGDDKHALLLLDKDMATRTFVAPVIG